MALTLRTSSVSGATASGGIRLDAEHYGRIVDELRGDFAKDDDTTPTDQLPEGGSA